MSSILVVGSQWGDEGKGKVVDLLAQQADMVVRYQGGANAGHTLVVDGVKTVLHLIPSGVLSPTTTCVISSGVVVDIVNLCEEIEGLKNSGHLQNNSQLLISDSATIILPYHKKMDSVREKDLGEKKIGTTGKGIGPAYEDKASRKALLFRDIFSPKLEEKLKLALKEKNHLIEDLYKDEGFQIDKLIKTIRECAEKLAIYRCKDTSLVVYKAIEKRQKILFEGAQGTLLDITHGTYPYVTSSSTIAGSCCIGVGIGPKAIDKVLGITKAYTTRVGSGPFPTELNDDIGKHIQKVGHEFGATTGRERRCGWIDLVALKYAIRINGLTNIALMKLDCLSELTEIKVCKAYEIDGQITTDFPCSEEELLKAKPIYESLKGWNEDITKIRNFSNLPKECKDYVSFLGHELSTPIDVVSVGPGREETLYMKVLFD